MAVSKKGKRKVNYKGRPFIWSVQEKAKQVPSAGGFVNPNPARYIHIIATNKKFMIRYKIPQDGDEYAELHVEGAQFPRQPGAKLVQVPRWKHDSKKYPTNDFVRRLIGWCMGVGD